MYWKSIRKKLMQTIRQCGQRVSMEGHIQNCIATGDHVYYICLFQLKFVSKYELMIILLSPQFFKAF